MRAALAAASSGSAVSLVSKNDKGNSTKSPAFTRYTQDASLINKTGDNMSDPALVHLMCDHSESEIDALLPKTNMVKTGFGFVPRVKSGRELVEAMRSALASYNVTEYAGYDLVDILERNGKCHGAFIRKGSMFILLYAGATILATGGYANCVGPSDNVNTVNGYGIYAAFRRGAVLLNPEFIMSHPFGIEKTKNIVAGETLQSANIVDQHGHPFLDDDLTEAIRTNNYHHLLSQINRIFAEKMDAGDKIYLDYGLVDADSLKQIKHDTVYGRALNFMNADKKIPVCPIYHYSLGGLQIDKNAQTNIECLYAAGEITSGVHGSSRLGGNAISESLVFGGIAGAHAAATAASSDSNTRETVCHMDPVDPPRANIRMVKDAWYLKESLKKQNNFFIRAILESSLSREESVGYFLRSDYLMPAKHSRNHRIYLRDNRIKFIDETR